MQNLALALKRVVFVTMVGALTFLQRLRRTSQSHGATGWDVRTRLQPLDERSERRTGQFQAIERRCGIAACLRAMHDGRLSFSLLYEQ